MINNQNNSDMGPEIMVVGCGDSKLSEEVSFYDQVINTVSKGVVCAKCLDEDEKLWLKYRNKKNE